MIDAALREDAPAALAQERERALQAWRERFDAADGTALADAAEAAAATDWIARLGLAGHVGAARLLLRMRRGQRALLERACGDHPALPGLLARHLPAHERLLPAVEALLAAGPLPDAGRLAAVLDAGPAIARIQAAALRQFAAAGGRLQWADWWVLFELLRQVELQDALPLRLQESREGDARRGALLARLAEWRLAADDAPTRQLGERLALAAGQAGSSGAWVLLWEDGLRRAGVAPAQLRAQIPHAVAWFEAQRPAIAAQQLVCLAIGAMLERGSATRAPDLGLAIPWYERGLRDVPAYRGDGRLHPEFCARLVRKFDPHGDTFGNAPELWEAWRQRALDTGEPFALAEWLQPRLAAQPRLEEVEPLVRRWVAACTTEPRERWFHADLVRAMLAIARGLEAAQPPDVAQARRWRALADLLDPRVTVIPRD